MRGPLLHATTRQHLNGANDICQRLVNDAKSHLSPKTCEQYAERCGVLQRRFPELRANEFEQHHIDAFFTFTDDGVTPRPPVGSRGWKESTINGYLNAFVFVFEWAFDHDLIQHNPALRARKDWGQKRVTHREGVWLDPSEIEELCDLDVGDDLRELRNRTLCLLLVGTGLREFEAASLCWGQLADVSRARGRIRVYGKGKKYRDVHPLDVARVGLLAWRDLHTRLRGVAPADGDPVIPTSKVTGGSWGADRNDMDWERGLGVDGIGNAVEQGGIRIGRPRLRPHDLRRSHAGFLEDKGVSLRAIQEQLGHASLATTEIYLQNNPGRLESEFAKAGI